MSLRTVGLEQGRNNLPELASRANAGEPSLLTRHGKPYAAIVSPTLLAQATRRPSNFLSLRGTGTGLWGSSPARHVADLRDEWEDA
ncbi:type II toxin-antitoxin system Phd/YefM family antitoxin [Xenophilus arseniciresistens]|uniref:Type II toxin-antitoxin system Phd/YefM family antitoxin n=1 Tax=Xenophilus arseniciresistens TaxID=1283306 RepID=A0AAE3NDI5_9BURK|nr:type II toxin-antitoxin system Phd/YefM family antitoxin [Xenophilus arseniciresistens]MDA7417629.1 type II toxin-antitoxin system Phd/YefM family antitoxin [Xenophilus arseniciresistens]